MIYLWIFKHIKFIYYITLTKLEDQITFNDLDILLDLYVDLL